MVAKISLGNSLYGALVYNGEKINKEKGRLLDTNKIFNDGTGTVNIHRAFEDFKRWMPANSKAEKTMMHISLNPHPDDRLSDVDFAGTGDGQKVKECHATTDICGERRIWKSSVRMPIIWESNILPCIFFRQKTGNVPEMKWMR